MAARFTQAYLEHIKQGPFPNQIDPWAEKAHFFHQIHGNMTTYLQNQLQTELMLLGYDIGREASRQIVANRKPDIFVEKNQPEKQAKDYDYVTQATALGIDHGVAVLDTEVEPDALHIYDQSTGDVVTVIEIISPSNKRDLNDIICYIQERQNLFLAQGVNVVEIDATRSIKRIFDHSITQEHPYHIAIYMPGEYPRFVVSQFGEPLKPFALPLLAEVIRAEPQMSYTRAYQQGPIANIINRRNGYALADLPFSSTLTENEKSEALEQVKQWQAKLATLAQERPEGDA